MVNNNMTGPIFNSEQLQILNVANKIQRFKALSFRSLWNWQTWKLFSTMMCKTLHVLIGLLYYEEQNRAFQQTLPIAPRKAIATKCREILEEHLFKLNVVALKWDRELCTRVYKPAAKHCCSGEQWTSVLWWPLVENSSMDRDDGNASGNHNTRLLLSLSFQMMATKWKYNF